MKNKTYIGGCPHHLSGDLRSPAAKKAYQEIEAANIEDLQKRYGDEVNKIGETETYGLAGHVIVSLWKHFKQSDHYDSRIINTPELEVNAWKNFNLSCIEKLDGGREKVIRDSYEKRNNGEKEDWINFHYPVYASIQKDIETLAIPSFIDYIIFFTAIAEVVEKLGEDTRKIMKHPKTKKIFTDLMQNSREFLGFFIAKLEGYTGDNPMENINDEYRVFQERFFEIKQDKKGKKYIQIEERIVQNYRESIQKTLTDIQPETATKLKNNIHGCPLLYTGLAMEIYDWLYNEMLKIKKGS